MACKLCASQTLVVGSVVRIKLEVKDDSDALVDPSTLVFKLLKPDGSSVTYTYLTNLQLVRDSLGMFHVDYKTDQPGVWTYRFESTGAGEGAVEDDFEVTRSSFP